MKYNDNGEYKDIYVKAFDTLPVGSEVDYNGSTVPSGWEEVDYYSTDEVDTGLKWIDGSEIYRKVFEIPQTTISSSSATVINFTLFDANYVLQISGMIGVTTSNYYYPLIGGTNRANTGYQVRRISGGIQIVIDTSMSAESSIKGGQLIVEYIKTN